jgi:hypothetical protein
MGRNTKEEADSILLLIIAVSAGRSVAKATHQLWVHILERLAPGSVTFACVLALPAHSLHEAREVAAME